MPIYEFACPCCGLKIEELMKYEEMKKAYFMCNACELKMVKCVSLPAKTASLWHGNWSEGLSSNDYSLAAGRRFANKREEERWMSARGFVSESELGSNFIEDANAKQVSKIEEQIKREDKYRQVLEETGDEVKAVSEAWPAQECLNGTLDDIYDESIST